MSHVYSTKKLSIAIRTQVFVIAGFYHFYLVEKMGAGNLFRVKTDATPLKAVLFFDVFAAGLFSVSLHWLRNIGTHRSDFTIF